MPLKFTNRATGLTILWENEDRTRTATFVIPKQTSEREQVEALLKAVGFLGLQVGIVSAAAAAPSTSAPTEPAGTVSAVPAATAPAPSGPLVPMMSPASLSDRPADGGRPGNFEFWQSMPTMAVPEHLAGDAQGGWEMIPPEEM